MRIPGFCRPLTLAAKEFENRRLETDGFYKKAVARNNTERSLLLATSLKLLQLQRAMFFRVQGEQARLAKGPKPTTQR